MKTNKEDTGKKDWQKVEARVLGQILAAQNVDFVLPDISHIAEFFAETLNTIPGVTSCRVCLEEVTVQGRTRNSKICEECKASRKRTAGQDDVFPFLPGLDFTCGLGEQPGMHLNVVASLHHHFGYFIIQVSNPDVFNVYIPFIGNLANYVALSLENRLQRDLLQKSQIELERKVEERTQELKRANAQLQEEVEIKQQAEKALQHEQALLSRIMETSPVGITLVDREGQITFANSQAEKVLGLTRDVITQRTYNAPDWHITTYNGDPFPEEDLPFQQVISTGQPVHDVRHMISWPDGHRLFLSINGAPILNEKDNVDSVVFTVEDITERRQAEEELRQNREAALQFSKQLATLQEVTNELSKVESPDDLCLLAVQLGSSRLGFDRVSIWFIEEHLGIMRGSFGMDECGGLRDERNAKVEFKHEGLAWQLYSHKEPMALVEHCSLYDHLGQEVGEGDNALAALWDGDEVIGVISIDNLFTGQPIRERQLEVLRLYAATLGHLITRKRAEEARRASEERLQLALDAAEMGQWEWNIITGEIIWSQQCLALYGLPPDTLMSYEKFLQALHPDDRERVGSALSRAVDERASYDEVKRTIWLDGTIHWTASRGQVYCDAAGEPSRMVGVTFDISKWKEAETQLLASEQLFRALVENSPDFIARYDREFRRIYVNPAIQRLFTSSMESVLGRTPTDQTPLYAPQVYIEHLQQAIEAATESTLETPFRTVQGEMHWGQIRFVPEIDPGGKVVSVLTIGRDIHEIKENEQSFRMLAENFPDFVIRFDRNGRCTYVNPTVEDTLDMPAEAIIGKTLQDLPYFSNPEQNNVLLALILRAFDEGIPNATEAHWNTEIGERTFDIRYIPEKDATRNVISVLSITRDITERKQHEREREAIIMVSTALRQATTRTEILNVILDQLVNLFDTGGAILVLPDPKTEGCINEMGRGAIGERMIGLSIPSGEGVGNWVITNKKNYLNNRADQDPLFYRPDLLGDSHCLIAAPLIAQEQAIGALLITRQMDFIEQDLRLLTAITDIAANAVHRVTLHEQTEQQLHRLVALHLIDLAISTNIDLNITLNVILGNVKDELEVDAASILLLDPITHILNYADGVGFRSHNIEQSHVGLGKGCAGRAAQELRTISGLDIGDGSGIFVRSSLLASEEFMSHYATPLLVKGQIKGVLEVFHRKPLEPEHTWFSYFETLATQAAIAIENTSLFENLQRSNTELTLAYDATIEGWSRALDLRDRETEGHTQRVADMALELAEKMGMNDVEMLDLRRGALLHDIGKMGVPDAILLKPGPLSDAEWEIMRQHPLYAYQMLSPITYLKRALEIPYCHHEKWDGSGYPRGLKEDEIPLSARVFSVVDVFDALISDRPYSRAWQHEEAYRYIQEQAGKYFDPQVVKKFLESR